MITDQLYVHADKQPEKVFLVFGTEEITYGEMAGMVAAFAQRLHDIGIRAGSRVALLCGNRPAFLVSWFAISELGAIAVPLNVSLVGEGLRYTLSQSEAQVVLIEPELYEAKRDVIDGLADHLQKEMIDAALDAPRLDAPARWRRDLEPEPTSANSILYTSGTTGLPKGAVLPHQAYVSAGIDMVRSLEISASDRIMVFLPLFHANPQMYAVTSTLLAGATMILLPKFSARRFFEDALAYGATGFTYVGTVLSILEKQHPGEQRAHQLKWCVGGGAPERVWREIESRFSIRVNELYGMTETGGWVTMNTADETRLGSVGRPRQGVEISVRDPQGQPLGTGEKGEITALSSIEGMFFTEYWNNAESTVATLKQGWLYTGDRGYLDEDGYLYFDGRVKELIRRGGEMIAPTEIEQQLLKHPAVKDCAVLGVPDEILGEEIKAVIVVSQPVTPEALRHFLTGRIPDYMIPYLYGFVDEIPKTETQKIKRHELARLPGDTVDTRATAQHQKTLAG
ncbi:MAG: AMP-binding protein [Candidimonas sp.]|nr:AMP-binding protein [Candidimonas sp.]